MSNSVPSSMYLDTFLFVTSAALCVHWRRPPFGTSGRSEVGDPSYDDAYDLDDDCGDIAFLPRPKGRGPCSGGGPPNSSICAQILMIAGCPVVGNLLYPLLFGPPMGYRLYRVQSLHKKIWIMSFSAFTIFSLL